MNDHKHGHAHHAKPGLHKDWRTWVVVAVMLVAIGTYVATLDDATLPMEPAAPTGSANP